MINKYSTTYSREDKIDFIFDDDPKMSWISKFDSSHFNRFFVIIDENVHKIYWERLKFLLEEHGKKMFILTVPAEEKSKSLSFYPKIISFLEKDKCNLSDLIIAIGGGIILDLTSFTCSTYMRGIPFYAVPTTLIGQIDASNAGKTCLNTEFSKNLLGTFYYPLKVYNNIHFLETNTPYFLRQGYSEMFKYGLLDSPSLITDLKNYFKNPDNEKFMSLILKTNEVRIAIRKKNPLASNLGHTFGHAIEKISNFKILHGDAISAGTVLAIRFAENEGIISHQEVEKIISIMVELGLNIYLDKEMNMGDLVEAMTRDKKSSSKELNLVLITGIGKPYKSDNSYFYSSSPKKVLDFLNKFIVSYSFAIKNCAEYIKKDKIKY